MSKMNNNLVINSCMTENNQYVNQNWFQQHLPFNNKKLFENNLTFTQTMANTPEEEDLNIQRKKSSSRDPLSHRIIEKRRRDRMNNCLADLSRLIPTSYLKKSSSLQGRGRIEKTEIIEMAIKHMKHLQAHKYCTDDSKCELSNTPNLDEEERLRQYRLGYQECLSEAIRFLVEIEGLFTGDGLCRRMMDYLQNHMSTIHKVSTSSVKESELSGPTVDDIPKVRSPSLSDSTASANEKMDVNDIELDTKPFTSKPIVTSHLREMLESSSISKRSKSSPHISLSSGSPSVSPNNCNQNNDQNVYNFKKEIKDRFQAERGDQKGGQPFKSISPSNVAFDDERVSNSSLSSLTTQASDHRSETSGYSSNSSNKSLPSMPSMVVPIFALHPSGNYYMPLTIDASVIAPHISKEAELNIFPVLHPINITVNFSYQMPHQMANHSPEYNRPPPQVWPPVNQRSVSFSAAPPMANTNSNKMNYNNNNQIPLTETVKFDPIWLTSLNNSSKFSQLSNKLK